MYLKSWTRLFKSSAAHILIRWRDLHDDDKCRYPQANMQMNTISLLLTERGLDCFLLGILCSGSGRRRVIETSPSRRDHVTLHPDLTSKVTRKHNNGSVGATLVLDSRRRSRPDWRRFRRPRMRRRSHPRAAPSLTRTSGTTHEFHCNHKANNLCCDHSTTFPRFVYAAFNFDWCRFY